MSTSTEEANPNSDQSSPYYIHPNENPALILVSPPLDGSNYHSWARGMKMALLSKNKMKFVDGSLPPPLSTDKLFSAWERCNNLVQGWLTKSLSPSIAKSILWFDSAAEIWSDLKSRYAQADIFRIADLQEEIYSLKQGSMTVSEYYTQLKILWDELANIRPLKVCACGSTQSALSHRSEDQVIRFLKGLNDQFSTVKSQIMLLDPLPPINKVFSLVLQQEREIHNGLDSKIFLAKGLPQTGFRNNFSGFGSNSSNNSSGNSQVHTSGSGNFSGSGTNSSGYNNGGGSKSTNNKHCTFCNKPRHTEDTCYRKHGFPPGFKFRSSASSMVNQVSAQDSGSSHESYTAPHSSFIQPSNNSFCITSIVSCSISTFA